MLASGEVLNLENALVLHSYSSRVAVYCKMRVYLLPRYNYSVTTWKHVHAFIQDYCRFVWDTNAREMRKIAALGVDDVEKEYAFAEGIVEGCPLKMSTAKVVCYWKRRMFASVRTHPSSRYLVKRGTQQPRIRSTFTMFATRNEVYSEFANAVLDEF